MATFSPSLRTCAALWISLSCGITLGLRLPSTELKIAPCSRGGSEYSDSCTSSGMITAVTEREALATCIARSIRCRACGGDMQTWTNSEATSLNRETRSTSCW